MRMEATIYNKEGKKSGSVNLPENVFGVAWNDALMHQVVTSMQGNARPRVAHTKGRGDVRGGGRKPWRQKGTGRARHGSIRSPIWRGGGVTHGPRSEKNYSRTIPRGMRSKALFMALSRKLKDNEVIFIDSFGMKEPKTALAKKTLAALSKAGFERMVGKRKNAALVALSSISEGVVKSFRNIGSVSCMPVSDLNPVAVLSNSYLVIENPEAALPILSARGKK
ncbi:50S ribosomal protein L4 [Candidatus Kaiserbacteria bacterium]|nr:50S ribosomal protein L4 [Candidatus Kaiserbacteria bacterium]